MKRATVIGLLALCYTSLAQDTLETVVEPRARPSKNILLLVDNSGSMAGKTWAVARGYATMIAGQGTDQASVAVMAFGEAPQRWSYKKATWARLPDDNAVKDASSWLDRLPATGSTFLLPALSAALAEKVDPLTVVVVTDGLFSEDAAPLLAAVEVLQAARAKRGMSRAVIVGLGLTENDSRYSVAAVSTSSPLGIMAQRYGGGLYVRRVENK